MQWLNVFKHLLPTGRAWRITIDKALRQLFDGLTDLPEAIRLFFDLVYLDVLPQSTRFLDLWEDQFGLPETGLAEQARRDRLQGSWSATGGQSPSYIETTLQNAGFDVYVHEFWVPGSEPAIGVKACATVRDPNTYLVPADLLVNKIADTSFVTVGDGSTEMQDGDLSAQDGGKVFTHGPKTYALPTDPTKYPFFVYIGAATFPTRANVPATRRGEFEDLCLKICPEHLWIGTLVTYI